MNHFAIALHALPMGTFATRYSGRRYVVTKSAFSGGRAIKLVAEERGGADYISLNWYELAAGGLLKPCEMPEAKVVAFVLGLCVEQEEPDLSGRPLDRAQQQP